MLTWFLAVLMWGRQSGKGTGVPAFRGGRDAARAARLHNPDASGRFSYFADLNADGLQDIVLLIGTEYKENDGPWGKNTFTAIGKEFPDEFSKLEAEAARFMALNNTVVLSVRCWGSRASAITFAGVAVAGALVACGRAFWSRRS